MKQISHFFEYSGIVLLIINTILFLKSYASFYRSIAFKYFSIYLSVSLIVLIATSILSYYSLDNLYLSHIYFISQFLILSLFYKQLFNKIQEKIINIIVILVLTTLTFQYISKPTLLYKFNIFEVFITSFPVITYSIVHLYNSLSKKGDFMFINAGILIYLSISTLIFILGDYLSIYEKNNTIKNIWLINKVLYVVYLSLILVEWKKTVSQAKNK